MRKLIAPLLLAAALFLGSCPEDSNKQVEQEGSGDVPVPIDIMGMVHAGSSSPVSDPIIKARFDILDEIGVKWMLDDFSWGTIQQESKKDSPGEEWNWSGFDTYVANANARGKKVHALLDYDTGWLHGGLSGETAPFVDYLGETVQVNVHNDGHIGRCILGDEEIAKFCAYVRATVTRYNGKNGHGKVDAWGIWNEPNLQPRFWTGTMEEFFKLSIAAANAIREVLPDAVITVGAYSSIATDAWIKSLYTSGAADKANFVTFHPYATNPSGTDSIFKMFVEKSAPAFRNKIWVTEVGHPTGGNYPTRISEDRMPQTIVKTITMLAASGAQKIFWYHLSEGVPRGDENDSENWFGLYTRDSSGNLTEKAKLPAAYKLAAEHIPGKTWRKDGLPGVKLPDNIHSHYFEGDDEKKVFVVWNNNQNAAATVQITLPGTGHILHDPTTGTSAPAKADDSYTLPRRDAVTEKVLFFTW